MTQVLSNMSNLTCPKPNWKLPLNLLLSVFPISVNVNSILLVPQDKPLESSWTPLIPSYPTCNLVAKFVSSTFKVTSLEPSSSLLDYCNNLLPTLPESTLLS